MSSRYTDALRPGALLEARMAAAYRDGEDTARRGEPRTSPWRGDSVRAVERVLARMWARGYSAGNPVPRS
jgi:hypothetical protein